MVTTFQEEKIQRDPGGKFATKPGEAAVGGERDIVAAQKEWEDSLDEADKEAFVSWSADGDLVVDIRAIQADVKGHFDEEDFERWEMADDVLSDMNSALASAPKTSGTFFRGLSNLSDKALAKLVKSKTMKWSAHSSASKSIESTERFFGAPAKGQNNVILSVEGSGVDISGEGMTADRTMEEVLLLKDTKYKVIGVKAKKSKKGGKLSVISIEEVS